MLSWLINLYSPENLWMNLKNGLSIPLWDLTECSKWYSSARELLQPQHLSLSSCWPAAGTWHVLVVRTSAGCITRASIIIIVYTVITIISITVNTDWLAPGCIRTVTKYLLTHRCYSWSWPRTSPPPPPPHCTDWCRPVWRYCTPLTLRPTHQQPLLT